MISGLENADIVLWLENTKDMLAIEKRNQGPYNYGFCDHVIIVWYQQAIGIS